MLLDDVKTYVEGVFQRSKNDKLIYHNLDHTEHVVRHVEMFGEKYELNERDFFIVKTAAWFHDLGYLFGGRDHEQKGAEESERFLASRGVERILIDAVKSCILATKMPQKPEGLLQEIVCDADLFHFGSTTFLERNKLMRKEAQAVSGSKVEKDKWNLNTVELLQNHEFHTSYARDNLSARKQDNLRLLMKKLDKEAATAKTSKKSGSKLQTSFTDDKKIPRNDRPERGIETMFRISSNNHQRLSDMADNKAHIMISTNSIILSVILSILLRRLEDNPHLIVPTIILLTICLVAMVFSILATRPSLSPGTFTQEDIEKKRVNLLFFGNFYQMSFKDYQDGMHVMMENRDFLYGSLIRDLYSQGIVLGRKYKLLRVAYNVFMFGIISSVVAYVVAVGLVID